MTMATTHAALLGYPLAVTIGTLLGFAMARVAFLRSAIGPVLTGLRSLPAVVWVPVAVLWLGLDDAVMYAVFVLGAAPAVAGGVGADYVSGLKQGWAFSWRALLAAELIASWDSSPDTLPTVLLAALLVLTVGIAVDLLLFTPLAKRTGLAKRNRPVKRNREELELSD